MNEDFVVVLVLLGISITINVGLALAWFGAHRRLQRLETRPADRSQLDDLMARVDGSLDAVTRRMDDLVSTQDFMNRVLTDRLDRLGRALPAPEPHDTPV